jgi:drug/metabolite transporter (DMT)-like permease
MSALGHDGRTRAGLGLAVLSAASFGLSGPLAGGLLATGWSPGAVVLVRMSVAALVLAPLTVRTLRGRGRTLVRHAPAIVFYGAVPVALAQFAYFSAVARMDVGPALLIEYTAPAAVVAWLWLRRGERPSRLTVGGAVVCALGLVLVLDLLAGPSLSPIGVGWALLAMTGAASYFLLSGDGLDEVPPLGLAGCGLAVGAFGLGLLGAVGVLPMHASTAAPRYASTTVAWWLPLLALGAVTAALAYCAGIGAIRRLGSRVASFVALLEVLSGVVFAWLLLAQVPGPLQGLGGALLLAGIVVVKLGETGSRSARLDDDQPADRFGLGAGEVGQTPHEGGGDALGVALGQLGPLAGEHLVDGVAPQPQPALEMAGEQRGLGVQRGVDGERPAAV